MYVPESFRVDESRALQFVRDHPFAVLVRPEAQEPAATHLPLLHTAGQGGDLGVLRGHVAAANGQAVASHDARVLAVFSGPHAHVSAAWYGEPNTVPTWNYLAVHAVGTLRVLDDPADKLDVLAESVRAFEPEQGGWVFHPASEFVQRLLPAIVCFQIELESLTGAFKLSQHHPEERRRRAIEGLRTRRGPHDAEIADWMERPDGGGE